MKTSQNANALQEQGESENQNRQSNNTGNSSEAQRERILSRLKHGPASTIELRRELDILMPAARVHELRHKLGKKITTIWTHQKTECGKLHHVAKYVLAGGTAHV